MATEEQIRECARSAAEHLRMFGWVCGGAYSPAGPCCADGAITVTARGQVDKNHAATLTLAVAKRVVTMIPECFMVDSGPTGRRDSRVAMMMWNDAPSRTATEVIAVLERVAAGEGAS